MRLLFICLFLAAVVGCNRNGKPSVAALTEAGPGNYCQLGPLGLAVESVRLGKVRMRGMMGQDNESKDDVLTIKTRFKLFDTSVPVKQFVLQRDGMMMGGAGLKLKDENGHEFKPVGGFGFDAVTSRRTEEAILSAANPETTDVLTFESTAAAAGDLTLEIPGNWQVQQPDGKFLQPREPGTFRFRLPRATWEGAAPATEAGAENWATVGPVSVAVESVRVGKVKMRGFALNQEGESRDSVFAITVKVKLADPAAHVRKPPFVPDARLSFDGPAIRLKGQNGEAFPVVTGLGFDRIVGRQENDVELSAEKPQVTDLLTFDAKAAAADEVFLTLWPKWQQRQPDGKWVDAPLDGEFRFRIPKTTWAK